jgi:hypothetical protein
MSKEISEMSDQELIETLLALHDCIDVSDCYNTRDLLLYAEIWKELSKRGYKIKHTYKCALVIKKPEHKKL